MYGRVITAAAESVVAGTAVLAGAGVVEVSAIEDGDTAEVPADVLDAAP